MKKVLVGCLVTLGVVFLLLIALSVWAVGSSSSSSKTDVSDTAAKTEAVSNAVEDGKKAEETKQEEASDDAGTSSDSGLPADYIRPEFQEFIDSYLAFYREYAEFMELYNQDPTNTELLMGMSDMLTREADMVRAMEGWEAEDLTPAEQALLIEAEAEALRIYSGTL